MKYLLLFLLICGSAFASYNETEAVAAVIIREAGGEGHIGMWAVANVIQNRANKVSAFEVVSRPKQFSSVSSVVVTHKTTWENIIQSAKNHPEWKRAFDLAVLVNKKSLPDITGGATHFYSGDKKPSWAASMEFRTHIGGHYFYKES